MRKDFAIFILTHGRPEKVITYKTIKKAGYTGKIFIIIDDEDKRRDDYVDAFGKESVIIFNKKEIAKTFDEFDNNDEKRSIVYARNACFEIAKKLKLKYFMQLDDDYYEINYKFTDQFIYKQRFINGGLDNILNYFINYFENINVKSIALAQCGDFIGGEKGSFGKVIKLHRKAMNTFLCSTERPFKFIGRINEDVNTYTSYQSRGNVFLTIPNIAINQEMTQSNSGGMTDVYLENGTYVKSFFTVICSPSCTKIKLMGQTNKRLHHSIRWKNAVPLILDEKYKKK